MNRKRASWLERVKEFFIYTGGGYGARRISAELKAEVLAVGRRLAARLMKAEGLAAIRGRDFSTPDDVRDVALSVLRHRLSLRAEAELDGATTDVVIADIVKTVEVPR